MASRHLHGLFISAFELHREKVVVRIFTSRPTSLADLRARLTLADDLGTDYVLWATAPDVIDGKAALEFRPALPRAAGALSLREPGVGTHVFAREDSTIRR
jgi:hypothetical protein